MKKTTVCPICKKESRLDASNLFRPFCSERCRLIDLGEWIEENYTVSETVIPDEYATDYPDIPQKH